MGRSNQIQKNTGGGRTSRSAEQRRGSAAMVRVMQGWEELTDMERLAWDAQASLRRMKSVNYFKQVNLRRVRRGEQWIKVPPLPRTFAPRPLLKGLDIRNRDGLITLELQLRRRPDSPCTVWASLPCNRGLRKPHKCPRLGWLPARQGRWIEITKLYFQKHGETIKRRSLSLVGKRIFVRIRIETDDGATLYEEVKGVVPKPEVKISQKAQIPSKDLRMPFERPSNVLRSIQPATRHKKARATRRAH